MLEFMSVGVCAPSLCSRTFGFYEVAPGTSFCSNIHWYFHSGFYPKTLHLKFGVQYSGFTSAKRKLFYGDICFRLTIDSLGLCYISPSLPNRSINCSFVSAHISVYSTEVYGILVLVELLRLKTPECLTCTAEYLVS